MIDLQARSRVSGCLIFKFAYKIIQTLKSVKCKNLKVNAWIPYFIFAMPISFFFFAVPPRIHYVSHNAPLDVHQGANVRLECRASGNPVPTVAWTRKNNVLPSGERSVSGLTFNIPHADRHSAGQYQCTADNGVGQPDTRHITLNVLCEYL